MDKAVYSQLLNELKSSVDAFLIDGDVVSGEVEEDISAIIEDGDILSWESNIDGVIKDFHQLLSELELANKNQDRQKCIESIAMLRSAIATVASAFSNTMDSMEQLVISIRDNKK